MTRLRGIDGIKKRSGHRLTEPFMPSLVTKVLEVGGCDLDNPMSSEHACSAKTTKRRKVMGGLRSRLSFAQAFADFARK